MHHHNGRIKNQFHRYITLEVSFHTNALSSSPFVGTYLVAVRVVRRGPPIEVNGDGELPRPHDQQRRRGHGKESTIGNEVVHSQGRRHDDQLQRSQRRTVEPSHHCRIVVVVVVAVVVVAVILLRSVGVHSMLRRVFIALFLTGIVLLFLVFVFHVR